MPIHAWKNVHNEIEVTTWNKTSKRKAEKSL